MGGRSGVLTQESGLKRGPGLSRFENQIDDFLIGLGYFSGRRTMMISI